MKFREGDRVTVHKLRKYAPKRSSQSLFLSNRRIGYTGTIASILSPNVVDNPTTIYHVWSDEDRKNNNYSGVFFKDELVLEGESVAPKISRKAEKEKTHFHDWLNEVALAPNIYTTGEYKFTLPADKQSFMEKCKALAKDNIKITIMVNEVE